LSAAASAGRVPAVRTPPDGVMGSPAGRVAAGDLAGGLGQRRGLLDQHSSAADSAAACQRCFDLFVERLTDQRNTWRTATETS